MAMKPISRRQFLQSSATLAGGLVISFWLPLGMGRKAFAQAPQPAKVAPNAFLRIGKDGYFLSADGYLMPTKKGQAPPDLRYFKQSQK